MEQTRTQPRGNLKAYIAGPMTGYKHYNVGAFSEAAARWKTRGYQVETPFEANSRVWQRHHGRDFDPFNDTCEYGDPVLAEMFAEDVAVLCGSDVIVMLKGWEKSKGASSELLLALNLKKTAYDDETGKVLTLTPSLSFAPQEETALQEAQRLVHGARQASYGHPIEDFTRTGILWGAILGTEPIAPEKVGLCMVAVKISRECNAPKRDNRVDGAGYFETVELIHQRRAQG